MTPWTHVAISVEADIPKLRASLRVDEFWKLWDSTGATTWSAMIAKLDYDDQRRADEIRRGFMSYAIEVAGATCTPFCRFSDVGTTSPSSDIDVTVLNTRSSLVAQVIRDLFNHVFSTEGHDINLGTAFDVNVYCNAYYGVCNRSGMPTPVEDCAIGLQLDDKARLDQACWAMWRLPQGDDSWWDVAELKAGVQSMHSSIASCRSDVGLAVRRADATLGEILKAMKIKGVAVVRLAELRRTYVNAVSTVRALEEGAYISYGAFAHVVLSTQAGMSVDLRPLDYVASFFDNLGFFIEHENDADTLKLIKYFDRCVRAYRAYASVTSLRSLQPLQSRPQQPLQPQQPLSIQGIRLAQKTRTHTDVEATASNVMAAKKRGNKTEMQRLMEMLSSSTMTEHLRPIAHTFQREIAKAMIDNKNGAPIMDSCDAPGRDTTGRDTTVTVQVKNAVA